jgi:hypothetical protein
MVAFINGDADQKQRHPGVDRMTSPHTPADARSKDSTPNACHQARILSNWMKEIPALPLFSVPYTFFPGL